MEAESHTKWSTQACIYYCISNYQQGKDLANTSNPKKEKTQREVMLPCPPWKQR
jgi:hypothetical protein